jgi:D-aminoacyl-tRNA deacylase
MRFAIVYSKQNIAGTNIVEEFKKISFSPQIPIIEIKDKHVIVAEDISIKNYPQLKEIDFLIFASTHKSEKAEPSLSLHAPGNWRSADLGGQPGKICPTSAFVLKYLFQKLDEIAKQNKEIYEKYNITLEVTHHGPLTNLPCCFIELGSSETNWKDKQAAKILAETILSLQDYELNKSNNWISAIGLGGPHYAPVFNKIQLHSNYAIGHIIPQYVLPLTESMLKQAEQKTTEQVKEIIIDWKGCGKSEQRQKAIELIEQVGLKYKRTREVEK